MFKRIPSDIKYNIAPYLGRSHCDLKQRVQKLLNMKLKFFYDKSFDNKSQKKKIVAEMPEFDKYVQEYNNLLEVRREKISTDCPEMSACYQAPLLTFEQEQHLFRKMNYFKWRANKMIEKLTIDANAKNEKFISNIEEHLAVAIAIRNQIAESNFRLAVFITKAKHVGAVNIAFYRNLDLLDSVIADGFQDVVKFVDSFDWTRKIKFSTYAVTSLKRNFFNNKGRLKEKLDKMNVANIDNFEVFRRFDTKFHSKPSGYEQEIEYSNNKVLVKNLLLLLKNEVGENEAKIIESYFGVNNTEERTLKDIANELGFSREKVRQLKDYSLKLIREKVNQLGLAV